MAISLTSSGIVFTGTQSPAQSSGSGVAYTLDDYEEGTWSPVIAPDMSNANYDPDYVKIGQLVKNFCYLQFNASTSSTSLKVSAMPFVTGTQGYETQFCPSNSATATFTGGVYARPDAADNHCYFYRVARGGGGSGAAEYSITGVNMTAAWIMFGCLYRTD